jgi:lactoylglutathione lyase
MNKAKAVVEEFIRRQEAEDETVLDDLVADNFVNHAAGPQGREGLLQILQTIDRDLGPIRFEQHHLLADGDLVVQHVTVRGAHRGSTMPLLVDLPVTGKAAAWRFIHIWRVANGMILEHWACRDDIGLIEQLMAR